MARSEDGFTKTQRRMLNVLADGKRHTREELQACMPDPEAARSSIKQHICNIRKRLEAVGQAVVCEQYMGGIYYRWAGKPDVSVFNDL